MSAQPLFEAYKLLYSIAPKSDRVQQAMAFLRWEIEAAGALTYEDPQTGELELLEPLQAPARRSEPRRATRGAVVTFPGRRTHAREL